MKTFNLQAIHKRALKLEKVRKRFKRYRREKNRVECHLSKSDRRTARQTRRSKHYLAGFVQIEAPTVLSFIRNPDEVSKFISELRECFDQRKPVFVKLKAVREIDYDGITVLLSVVVRFKAKRIRFNGDLPADENVKRALSDSGFFDHLLESKFNDRDNYALTSKSSIYTHAMKKVDSELGEKIIASASSTVWGEKKRCPGVQRVFLELMQNTNNHASLDKEGERHWWLSVKHDKKKCRVTFSFVDYGVGVFHSLRNKKEDSKFFGILEKLYQKVRYGNDSEVLKLIFQGVLHQTASGKPYRGKGLPGIYEAFQKNTISNFSMITNDVYFNSETAEYRVLKNNFEGTFVHWQLTKQNTHLNEN